MRDLKEYYRPESVEEAVSLKRDHGGQAVYLAGGSDLLVDRPERVVAAIDIRHCGISHVGQQNGRYVIGGGCRLRDAESALRDVAGGMLRLALRNTAPWLIRNSATVAGNIANASPAADAVPALLALDARLGLLGEAEEEVTLDSIFDAPHHTRLGDRLITEIRIPVASAGRRGVFIKLARSASDIALVNLAVTLHIANGVMRDVRVALGAVAPVPMRATATEALLEGQPVAPETLKQAERSVAEEVRPITDWRASEAYRRRMSGVLLRRALYQAAGGDERGAS